MARKNRKASVPLIWDGASEVPASNVPDMSAAARRVKWMRRGVRMSIVLTPILIIYTILSLGKTSPIAEEGVAGQSQGHAASRVAVEDWLGSDLSIIGGGQILSWDGYDSHVAAEDDNSEEVITEVNRFTVVDESGQMYRVEVLSAVDPEGGVEVIEEPSLIPLPMIRDAYKGFDSSWGELPQTSVPTPVASAIKVWAKAFTSGDQDDLRLTVGDQSPGRSYLPLYDMTLLDVKVGSAASVERDEGAALPHKLIVRVELTMIRGVGELPPEVTSPENQLRAAAYDLLVERADTAAPSVVAWGGPGSGPGLTAYMNSYPDDVPQQSSPYIRMLLNGEETADGASSPTYTVIETVTITPEPTPVTPEMPDTTEPMPSTPDAALTTAPEPANDR